MLVVRGDGGILFLQSLSPGVVKTDLTETEHFDGRPQLAVEDTTDAIEYILSTPPYLQVRTDWEAKVLLTKSDDPFLSRSMKSL